MEAKNKPKKAKIAVLMTCFNRREITLKCLNYLFENSFLDEHHIQVYLVDDGSKDSTAATIRDHFASVKIIQGNGNLFWGGGTRLAFQEALKNDYPFYL
jgi:GT2 family glycosyltransferase